MVLGEEGGGEIFILCASLLMLLLFV